MPRRSHRSSSYRTKARKTQTGVHVHRERGRAGKARCVCGRPLGMAVRRGGSSSKSSRRSNRPYGGFLCPICAKEKALALARKQ